MKESPTLGVYHLLSKSIDTCLWENEKNSLYHSSKLKQSRRTYSKNQLDFFAGLRNRPTRASLKETMTNYISMQS